ncbi:MAG: helicase C-terminal domain-containing protein [Candidatus Thorarchaeota archaeon]
MNVKQFSHLDFFPYLDPRTGQVELMKAIENAVRDGKDLCCEAPNGFGKTCVTLCGVLPWVKENDARVLYCARTHTQLDRVVEEVKSICAKQGVSAISFRGRQHMCLNKYALQFFDGASVGDICTELRSESRCPFYDKSRLTWAADSIRSSHETACLTASEIVAFGSNHDTCPYEIAKELVKNTDVIALSYLYVLDPFIAETFMVELDIPASRLVLILDEAHNVPSTALESASDSLSVGSVKAAIQESSTYDDAVAGDICRRLARIMIDTSSAMDVGEMIVDPQLIYDQIMPHSADGSELDPLTHLTDLGLAIRKRELRNNRAPRSSVYRVASFLTKWVAAIEKGGYGFTISSSRSSQEGAQTALNLIALDPTSVTLPVLRRVRCTVAVSGTLSPVESYREMLGLGSRCITMTFGSPFSRERRMCIVVDGIDTSYEHRQESLYERLAEHCASVANATPGNTGVFTSSYQILESLLTAGLSRRVDRKLFVENQKLGGRDNDRLVDEFKKLGSMGGAVLLGVQGGRNSEGGDFPGPSMESVVVVGVPYAKPNPRTDLLIEYFDTRFEGRGREYAYVIPAMTRSVQAAGRPIRRDTDRGVIVFLDRRFGTDYLKRFMPMWLREVLVHAPDDPDTVYQMVREFFSRVRPVDH